MITTASKHVAGSDIIGIFGSGENGGGNFPLGIPFKVLKHFEAPALI
jgi:hypothetical protein